MTITRYALVTIAIILFCTPLYGSDAAVTVYYEGNAQVEVISSKGSRILIDIYDPSQLSKPATDEDILLTTHSHPDHINGFFLFSFSGQMLISTGEINTSDISIRGFPAPHNEGDPFVPENGTNYAFIITVDGLRIAHLGDIGQSTFTKEQLEILGKVDLAIMQFDNSYSKMNIENKKGFNLMSQLKPRLIIPTHNSIDAAKYAAKLWPCLYIEKPFFTISENRLPKETKMLFIGKQSLNYAKEIKATAVDW
jgi:L-ascorbate metabolism protein UlaG (beta-lactamase superfamily)